MIRDIKQGEYCIEGKLYSVVFRREIDIRIYDDVNIEYAQKCAEHFNSLSSKLVETVCRGAKAYCLDFMELAEGDWDEELTVPVNSETPASDMLKCFSPNTLIIEKPDNENITGYQLECSCEWEIEHGMEIDILDNEVVYLSSFNGFSPWDYENDESNYINKI